MEAALTRLKSLSADELREEILKANLKCGPITATTRAVFERKLARALVENAGLSSESSGGSSETLSATSAEEGDVGYHLGLNPPEEEPLCEKTVSPSQHDARTPNKMAETTPTFYYGVCPLWDDVLARNERVHVYTDKKEALQAMKMMKGARFKPFSTREDAEKFAKGLCDYFPSPSKCTPCVSPVKTSLVFGKDGSSLAETEGINREKANSFKSPRPQDLTARLRVCVERGDEVAFTELVWSNPRYLIGSGDNPTVLQEGCRYNVMHVAAKENQAGVAQLLLDTLENPDFMRLMYPDDTESMLHQRIHYIVDLYLNTPDKACFETPLHFACKFGCAAVVNVLCSHPDIDKHRKNKYDQEPCEIICERMKEKNKIPEIKQKIMEYLEDRCYVPLLRAADNSTQPVIGAPWSPEPMEKRSPRLPRSPRDPVMTVRAFAGPLSPSKADEFRRVWKTPPRERAEHFHHILKSDPERGAERVGRDLARELGHPWAEHWDFLDSFVDLSSVEGLQRLEEFLSKKDFTERARDQAGELNNSNKFRTPSPGKQKFSNSVSVGAFLDDADISLEEIKNRQNAALTSISSSSSTSCCSKDDLGGRGFHILPVSQDSALIEPRNPASSCPPSPISNLMVEFERMTLRDHPDRAEQEGAELSSMSSDEYFLAQESLEGEEQRARTRMGSNGERLICSRSRSWDHGSSASSSTSGSYRSLDRSNDLILTTPPRVRKGLFIEGDAPSRLDREVFAAVGGAEIDPLKYPSIHKWKSTIESYTSAEMQSWQTPAVLKSQSRLQCLTPGSPVSRYSPARHTHSPDYTSPGRYSPAHASYIQRIRLKHFGDSPI
ncbi:ankyrin repeat and LEM domain-containing protein 2 [Neoarius graeffei]|uniref:ankyrin repeat and LEM domain-containing protein 2 n=1 Tax=Neoarius graeffei TaxID=443677 RepID=UPI00298C598F|nr:ankyrin repeat and LEM domain-containing protein 2 [Neoarius graeffei]XP_060763725.1 ankyrin repeat and LEM domain-containing protein 2 [Neoarius graeffei]XP_060763726.1 ankyrin repeat and LEM domain-containing protein 2 [Neoarius graeffei]XP_060763727.1 ankyrin repeat and LEM domain-containing protein 2 [Neoarius graeffei]XP_060763728.1 ankyrin repeat and LEM domain-containing protein 2 [Neoarius graeffei]